HSLMGTPDRWVTSVVVANLYTDSYNLYNRSPYGWNSVSHTEGNLLVDSAAGNPYDIWYQHQHWAVPQNQMGAIGYRVLYTMHDQHSADMASYWDSNSTSLTGQLSKYTNDINPAISSWEGQVASYSSFYEQWKTNADALKEQAKTDYENSLADLETKKTAWLSKLEAERQDGILKWAELKREAASAESKSDIATLKAELKATKSSVTDFSTGTESVLSSYDDSLTRLTTKEFVFNEPVQKQAVITQNTSMGLGEFFSKDRSLSEVSKISVFDKVSTMGSFSLGGVAAGIGLVQTDPVIYKTISLVESATGAVGGFVSSLTGNTSGGQSYSIFNAASQKKVETSLKVDGKDISTIFSNTANGVYQYSQLLSTNENNERMADKEQEKLLNQITYGIKWEDRVVLKYNDNGVLEGNKEFQHILNQMNDSKFKPMTDCMAEKGATQEGCFKTTFKDSIAYMQGQGFEYQNGMIVRSLNKMEKILLGQTTGLTMTAEEKALTGTCYVDPTQCKSLLRQDYTYTVNKETNIATLTKSISNGQIGGRRDGKYISGAQTETRYVSLAEVKPIMAPKGKDLFDSWGEEEWDNIGSQQNAVLKNFYDVGLAGDVKRISSAANDISAGKDRNEKKFQEAKIAAESADSFIKDMIMAYISGGVA
ncbi:TIGR04388 family protein, partial [Leptospira ilyithenensis]